MPVREEIRRVFGERAERLAYLFHSCNRKLSPNNIENGRLFDRRSNVPLSNVSVQDIQALRLVEAANMLDQRSMEYVLKVVHSLLSK
jgi:hypothetical protein